MTKIRQIIFCRLRSVDLNNMTEIVNNHKRVLFDIAVVMTLDDEHETDLLSPRALWKREGLKH